MAVEEAEEGDYNTLLLIYRPGCASMYSWKEGFNHCDASYSTRQPTLEDVSTLQHDSWIYVARIFLPEISEDFPDPDKCLRYHVNEKTAMFGDCKEKQNFPLTFFAEDEHIEMKCGIQV
uniref:Uncharacterized protein n=1 Tax=Magallana gigas TaxID=29159 RepID=K1S071_MAGGI